MVLPIGGSIGQLLQVLPLQQQHSLVHSLGNIVILNVLQQQFGLWTKKGYCQEAMEKRIQLDGVNLGGWDLRKTRLTLLELGFLPVLVYHSDFLGEQLL